MTFIPMMSGSAVTRDHSILNNMPYQCASIQPLNFKITQKLKKSIIYCSHPQSTYRWIVNTDETVITLIERPTTPANSKFTLYYRSPLDLRHISSPNLTLCLLLSSCGWGRDRRQRHCPLPAAALWPRGPGGRVWEGRGGRPSRHRNRQSQRLWVWRLHYSLTQPPHAGVCQAAGWVHGQRH